MSMQDMHKALIRVRLDSALLIRGLTLSIAGLTLIGSDSDIASRRAQAAHSDPNQPKPSKDILLGYANLIESKSEFILDKLNLWDLRSEMNLYKNIERL